MVALWSRVKRSVWLVALAVAFVAVGGSAAFLAARSQTAKPRSEEADAAKADKLRRDGRDGVIVPASIAKNMGLDTAIIANKARPIRLPPLQGVLAVDNQSLPRVRSRFAGEIISIGNNEPGAKEKSALRAFDPKEPRVGDRVHKGDLLAVVLSKDLGEKKSELVDALSKLRADEALLKFQREGLADGSIPARSVWDTERAVESDKIAVRRAEQTLRTWQLTEDEIAEVRAEAGRLSATEGKGDGKPEARRADPNRWARVEVRAPVDGEILQRDAMVGDIVDTTTDLFKIGDLSHLAVWVHLYEEDLPLVQSLPRPVRWTVTMPSAPGATFPGTLDQIMPVLDSNQHTALVMGRVENPKGYLKVGQFVTVSLELPSPAGEIEVPSDAVLEDGRESVVFIQPDPAENRFVRTPVHVTRRFRDSVGVRAGDGLKPGDRVVTGGALLLRDAVDALPVPQQ